MRSSLVFDGETSKKFAVNSRFGTNYKATIQNLLGESITITVTNQNIQEPNPEFDTPAFGALTIGNGVVGVLNEIYDGWLITTSLPAFGTVEIIEEG